MGLRRKTGILTAFLLLIVLTVNPVFAAAVTGNTPVESVLQTEAVPADAHEGTAENEGMPEEAVQTDKDEDTEENGEKSEVSDVLQESDDAESAEEVTPEEVSAGEENAVEESAAEEVKSSEDSMPSPESQVPAAQKEETSSETSLSVPAGTETPEEAAEPEEALLTALEEEPVEEVLTPFEPEDGIYTIRTALSSFFVWDVPSASCEAGTAIQLYKSNGTDAQKYRILKNADKTYRIVNAKSDKALQTAGGSDKAGTGVTQNFTGTAACQKWLFFKDSEGLVQIVSALPGKYCISVENAKAANKAKLLTAVPVLEKENAGSQRFELQLLKTAAQDKPDTVKEGVYILRSALDTSMVMDVSGAKKTAGANVQLYKYNGTNAQKYIITQSGSNTFRIVNLNSFMAVGTQGHKTASATNVEQDVMADAATQDWAFEPADRGYYYIRNAGSGKYLDVKSAKRTNGTNIHIYTGNQTEAQKFRLELVDSGRIVPDGVYTIASKLSSTAVLDISGASLNNTANCQLYKSNGTDAQKFSVTYLGDGYYKILSANSGKALDVKGARNANGANVQQYTDNGTNAQKWKFAAAGNGYHTIYSAVGSDKVLDARAGRSSNGTNIQIYTSNGTDAQKFMLKPTQKNPQKTHVVEIDPGHQRHGNSGKEPVGPGSSVKKTKVSSGAKSQWTGQEEYQLNLDVSLKLKKELEKRGYKVYMTRTTNDVNLSNVERAKKATKDGAEILVRIHADDIDSTSVSGVLNMAPASGNPYMSSKQVKESQRLAKLLTKYQVKATGQKTRSNIYTNSMTGINWATMPVSIVEMGLMSNRKEAYNLADSGFQQKIAKGIADGIDAYFSNENP